LTVAFELPVYPKAPGFLALVRARPVERLTVVLVTSLRGVVVGASGP